ncbi:MAG: formylglycine-generating enzyme family protein [Patescibacteria group bacterium]
MLGNTFCVAQSVGNSSVDDKVGRGVQESSIVNSIGMSLNYVSTGSFMLGREREATINNAFYLGVYEVTQEEYEKVMGRNPSTFKRPGKSLPVDNVSYDDAVEFCGRLSKFEGSVYRLPKEIEWEYACRAGTKGEYYWGDKINADYCWYERNSFGIPYHPVGRKKPNDWGFYDMIGNVWEWCDDWYERRSISEDKNEFAFNWGRKYRVLRGGSSGEPPSTCNIRFRGHWLPSEPISLGGFRVMCEPH